MRLRGGDAKESEGDGTRVCGMAPDEIPMHAVLDSSYNLSGSIISPVRRAHYLSLTVYQIATCLHTTLPLMRLGKTVDGI